MKFTYIQLIEFIRYHDKLYYELAKPEISDTEYDKWYDTLVTFEKKQGWAAADSPTRFVGGGIKGKFQHEIPLYSLKKVYNKAELDPEFDIITPKIDGTNITITYENCKIVNLLTRGDGEYGNNIIHLVEGLINIPHYLGNYKGKLIITGEAVTENKVENFRNYVAGALNLNELNDFKEKRIKFIAHDVLNLAMNYKARMQIISNLGFATVLDKNIDYPTDGLVYRIDSYSRSKELGYTSKYPRFAAALKERETLTASTILQDVVWVVGRTGTVNPVGIVDPVVLDDATISRVTLHNIEIIEEHNRGLGDVIEIERAGGVIPKFLGVKAYSKHNQKITKEHAEAAIGLETKRDGPRLRVKDTSKYNKEKALEYFIKTIGIKGLGPQSIKKMGLLHPIDLYTPQEWIETLGANGSKIIAEIEKSKTKPYELVLASLGIPFIGKSTAKKIVEVIPSFDRLKEIEYVDIPTIGPAIKEQLLAWLDINEDWVLTLPLQLEQHELLTEEPLSEKKKVCISGKLDMTKSDMEEHLAKFGFTVKNSVTKDCYALISDGNASAKYKKAVDYGIPIINYWEQRNKVLQGDF